MKLISQPFIEVWDFLKLLSQLISFMLDFTNFQLNESILVISMFIVAALLLWRGYKFINLGFPVLYFALGVSYFIYLQRGNGDNAELLPTLILITTSILLIIFIGQIKFLLVGALIGIYIFNDVLGSTLKISNTFLMAILGVISGMVVTRYFVTHFNDFFDTILSFVTSLIGIIILLFAIGLTLLFFFDMENALQPQPFQLCGLIFVVLAGVFYYTSAQREHRIENAKKTSLIDETDNNTQPSKDNSLYTSFVAILIVVFFFFNGLPEADKTNTFTLPEPVNGFLINFTEYTAKLSSDIFITPNVIPSNEVTAYICPAFTCESRRLLPQTLLITDGLPSFNQSDIEDWYEIVYQFQLLYISKTDLLDEIQPPVSQQSINDE